MKKILSYILIAFVVVNLFAPLSVGINQNKITLEENVASADSQNITLTTDKGRSDTTITVYVKVTWGDEKWGSSFRHGAQVTLSGPGITDTVKEVNLQDDGTGTNTEKGQVSFSGLTPNTSYNIKSIARSISTITVQWSWSNMIVVDFDSLWKESPETIAEAQKAGVLDQAENTISVTTLQAGQTNTSIDPNLRQTSSTIDTMPECGVVNGTLGGCVAQILYYLIFLPTSFIFALAGNFFDFTFAYSVNDASYRSTFVVQGWGVVRDLCNMFFIFVLLYVAFKTILGLNVSKTKEMIINVIIIGIMINFSLFATQIIIDASNILARVFYNSNVIKINVSDNAGNGVTNATNTPGPNGEIQLSAALVNKVNPQQLILQATRVGDIPDKGEQAGNQANKGGITTGTFILVTLLASAVNIIGLIVFISVGLIFVARVIGLWMTMIFAPLAFFSYTVPDMQGMNMVGWKHWWPETLKLAFLAPIFIFFLYLILKFLETDIGIPKANDAGGGISFVISIIIPFVFIMALLWKAKDIAKTLSGSMGQTITGGIAAAGGLALGGAALGAAFAGRKVVGGGIAALSRTENNQKMVKYRQDLKDFNLGKTKTAPIKPSIKLNAFEKIGNYLNVKQEKVNEVDHARREIDSVKEKAGLKGVDDMNLSGVDNQKLKTVYGKEKRAESESIVRRDGAKYTDANGNTQTLKSEDAFKKDNRAIEEQAYRNANNIPTNKKLTDRENKDIENELNVKFNAVLKIATDQKLANDFAHLKEESKKSVPGYDRIIAQSNKGSYDVRNLSQTKTDKREGLGTIGTAALIAGVAMAVRTGLKNSGVNHGSGQADLFKDLGNTITEALKSTKINVKVEESHGKSQGDSAGGGHH